MSIANLELELVERRWKVASVVREGPAWRILLRATEEPHDTMTLRHTGTKPPASIGEMKTALRNPVTRTMTDEAGQRWRVEVVPRMEGGRHVGEQLAFSAERTSQRVRVNVDTMTNVAHVPDFELRRALSDGLKAVQPA